jgi:hypothetical protein
MPPAKSIAFNFRPATRKGIIGIVMPCRAVPCRVALMPHVFCDRTSV